MKRILEITGDLRLAFWLILSAGVVMAIGSIYASMEYSFINSMNGVSLVGWFMTRGIEKISVTWWIPVLFFVFLLLGINTFACTLNRILNLFAARKNIYTKKFFVLISPSVIHIMFLGMLAGHFLSFVAVTQFKIPFALGERVYIDGVGDVTVTSIRNEFFDESSLLGQRIKQTGVSLTISNNGVETSSVISFLKPSLVNGNIIQLDMEKKKENRIVKPLPENENCNKEKKFHYPENEVQINPQLYLIVTRDPGLFILLPGFIIITIIMGWYFYQTNFSRKKKDYTENENEIIAV